GGQQQRVAIARALVKDPQVLLADEPTGNLDEGTRDDIIALLEKLWSSRGLTLIMVTHDSVVAGRAQRRATMPNGRLAVSERTGPARARRARRQGPGRPRGIAGNATVGPGRPPSLGMRAPMWAAQIGRCGEDSDRPHVREAGTRERCACRGCGTVGDGDSSV